MQASAFHDGSRNQGSIFTTAGASLETIIAVSVPHLAGTICCSNTQLDPK